MLRMYIATGVWDWLGVLGTAAAMVVPGARTLLAVSAQTILLDGVAGSGLARRSHKTRPGHANTDDPCAGRQRGLARRWNSNRGSPRDCLAMSVKLVSANRSFPPALTAESRTDPCQGRSLNFQVHGNMGESFQLTPEGDPVLGA